MRVVPVSLALLASLAAAPAYAQLKPVIRASAVPESARLLNIEEINTNAVIELEWSATVSTTDSYEYEISYDMGRTTQTTTVTLIRLDDEIAAGENQGVVQSGALYRFRIRPQQIIDPEHLPDGSNPVDDATRNLVVRVYRASSPLDEANAETAVWKFQYDTRRPPAPSVLEAVSDENKLVVKWTKSVPDTDVDSYAVVYCPDIGSSTTAQSALPCADPIEATNIGKEQTSFGIEEGLENGITAAVSVRATDPYANAGEIGNIVLGTPREVTDFFEYYKQQGGAEDGGFCFIATAAYGSYAHPTVRVLRAFRDVVLLNAPGGHALVDAYYAASPPLAARIARTPWLAAWTRASLIPIAALAVLWMASPLFALLAIAIVLRRRARLAAAALAAALLAVPTAHAQELNRPRSDSQRVGFGFEVRGGPYLPALGDEVGTGGVDAFERIFGSRPKPLFVLAGDLQLYRGVGTAGVGGSFGFMQFVGRGFYGVGGPQLMGAGTTVFNMLPLTLTGFYRFDWIADRTPIPLVPYLRAGLAYHVWWVTQSDGDVARWEGTDPGPEDDVAARGGKLGFTGTAGIALLLNILDMDAALQLFDSTGIRGTYLFAEYQASKVDGFGGDGFDLSDATWNLGMSFEW